MSIYGVKCIMGIIDRYYKLWVGYGCYFSVNVCSVSIDVCGLFYEVVNVF